jgi:nucleoside permease NupC
MSELRGLLGLLVILAVAFLVSNNRSRIPWRTVVVGLTAQIAFAVLVLRWSVGKDVLDFVSGQVEALIGYTDAGIEFLFGKLVCDVRAGRLGDFSATILLRGLYMSPGQDGVTRPVRTPSLPSRR